MLTTMEVVQSLYHYYGPNLFVTGSRYFGCDNSDSDYDFLLPTTVDTSFLSLLGFYIYGESRYIDSQTIQVWRWGVGGKNQIDIQIVSNLTKKLAAQKLLREFGILHPTPTQWETALSKV